MPDTLGGVTVPSVSPSGTFPLTVDYGFTTIIDPPVKIHTFLGAGDLKREQRFLLGPGTRQWHIERELDEPERLALRNFWESRQSAYQPFTFNCPLEDGTTEAVTACFANAPLITDFMTGAVSRIGGGIDLLEVPTGSGPTYSVAVTLNRFPDATLATALTAQVQKLIKLVRIKPRLAGYPTIYISDQRCTIGGQLYLPRLLRWSGIQQVAIGMPGVGTESDNVQLVFGNADRVMTRLTDDVQLDYATVEILAYHVNSQTLIQLWSGEIVAGGWQSNTGPEFSCQCSDHISSPFLLAPPRIIDRKCNKFYTGIECPFLSVGALNPTDYPGADASFCDHGYLTTNGCGAHGMEPYYGGVIANPQSILTKDNSTGVWGLFRNSLVASSVINDSAYGHSIPIIITDIPFPVPALIISIRDEGDFLRALGVVGEGPITIDLGSTLDGSYNHGYPETLGFRYIAGNDPVTPEVDQMQMQPFDLPYLYSAGVAALELLIGNDPGIQPTLAAQHTMQALVGSGWEGWMWPGGAGSRGDVKGTLTNPVWVCVNLYLLCRRLYTASQAEQEAVLDFNTIVPAAAICDLQVDRIVELDQGQETQWKFIGMLNDQKPLRDWMADILFNCLGYFSFNFGKLAIGVRENGASTVAYTDGNLIYRSLKLSPLGPQFTRLSATFADREHNYVANTATFQDDDYAAELGGGTIALHKDAQINLSGTADISPATRLVVTRGREEVGGVTAQERRHARNPTWQTTILGLDTGVGAVASITNEDMPGGVGKARIARWSLTDDWSITFEGRACTNSMYDLVQGPKPADVRPSDIPGGPGSGPDADAKHACWMPNTLAPPAGDPIRGVWDLTFALQQTGTPTDSAVNITGEQPVNLPQFKPGPRIADAAAAPGGNLPPGEFFIALACLSGTQPSAASAVKAVTIPLDQPGSMISLTGLTWPTPPTVAGWDSVLVFAAASSASRLCWQQTIPCVGGVPPDTLDFLGDPNGPPERPVKYATYNAPNAGFNYLRTKIKQESHPGCVPSFVSAVSGDTFTCLHLASDRALDTKLTEGNITWDPDSTLLAADNWVGRIISVITHKIDGVAPIVNMTCTAYDSATGTFTCTPAPETMGVGVGDVFIVRFTPTWSPDGTVFTDPGMFNGLFWLGTYGAAGFEQIGRVIEGRGKGQTRRVTGHDDTSYTFDPGFDDVDATSILIIEFAEWLQTANGDALSITDLLQSGTLVMGLDGLLGKGLLVQGVIVSSDKVESPDDRSEVREFFPFDDVSYGVGGELQLALEVEFGRGSDGGPAAIAVDDISSIREFLVGGFFQGVSVVNEGLPVGDSTIELQKQDGPGLSTYTTIMTLTIPDGTHDTVIYKSAFDLALEDLTVEVGMLCKVHVATVGATPPLSPVVKIYVGGKLAKSSGSPLLGNVHF